MSVKAEAIDMVDVDVIAVGEAKAEGGAKRLQSPLGWPIPNVIYKI